MGDGGVEGKKSAYLRCWASRGMTRKRAKMPVEKSRWVLILIMMLCNACNTIRPTQLASISPLVSPLNPKSFASPIDVTPVQTARVIPTVTATPTMPILITPVPIATTQPVPTPTPSHSGYAVWMTKPTYEVNSPMFFLAEFDTAKWSTSSDQAAQPSITHQTITGCQVIPSGGMGLPPDYSVSRSYKQLGALRYELNAVSHQGELAFINYCTYWSEVSTCFGVRLQVQKNVCIQDAEAVLKTARIYNPLATAVP
jgi:hypothetical protein